MQFDIHSEEWVSYAARAGVLKRTSGEHRGAFGKSVTYIIGEACLVKERLHVYHDQTEPLKEYYASKGKLVTVEGQEQVADTTALTLAAIEKFRG